MSEKYIIKNALATIDDRRLTIEYEYPFYVLTVVDNADLMSYSYIERVEDGDSPADEIDRLTKVGRDMLAYQSFRVSQIIIRQIEYSIGWAGTKLSLPISLPPKVV